MDPVQNAVTAFLHAVQAAEGAQPAAQGGSPQVALAALLGQEVNLLFQGSGPDGLLFSLPSGQTLTAQGTFPYPEGTQLLARVTGSGDASGIRLQTLEATPPAQSTLLAPLTQGEGQALLARLTQPDPPATLASLVELFQALGGSAPAEPAALPQAPDPAGTAAPGQAPGPDAPTYQPTDATPLPLPSPPRSDPPGPSGSAAPTQGPGDLARQLLGDLEAQAQAAAAPAPAAAEAPAYGTAAPPPPELPAAPGESPSAPSAGTLTAQQAIPMANPLPAETPAQPLVPLAIQLALAAPSQPPDAGQALPPGGASPPGALAAAPWGLDAGTAMSAGPVGQGAQPTATAPPAVAAAGTPPSDGTPGATGSADAGGVPVLDATSLAQGLAAQPAAAGPLPAQDALQALLKTLPAATVQTLGTLLPPGKGGADSAQLLDAVQRVQAAVVRQPDLPQGQGDALVQLLRSLLRAADPGAARGLPAAPAQNAPASPHAAAPEAWETWLKASMKALSDPAVSPREAPFHAAQAKEGTALFEVPLPWGAQTPLQIWTEADGQGQGKGGKGAPTSRLLLGMSFSKLGETRLGLARSPDGLQVRVWAQHPEALLRAQASMEEELAELDTPVDLKILPLEPGPGGVIPSIRSIASGSTFQVLG